MTNKKTLIATLVTGGIVLGFCIMIILLNTVFTGWKNYFFTEASLSRIAERLLEEKYDEEFIIHDVWTEGPGTFIASCSPVANPEVVFEIEAWRDGSEILYDRYMRGYIAYLLENDLSEKLQEVFPDCYVMFRFAVGEDDPDYYEGCTVEAYYNSDPNYFKIVGIYIFVDKNKVNDCDANYDSEYRILMEIAEEIPGEGGAFSIYFISSDEMDECVENCSTYYDFSDKLYERLENGSHVALGFIIDSLNITELEYSELRRNCK